MDVLAHLRQNIRCYREGDASGELIVFVHCRNEDRNDIFIQLLQKDISATAGAWLVLASWKYASPLTSAVRLRNSTISLPY